MPVVTAINSTSPQQYYVVHGRPTATNETNSMIGRRPSPKLLKDSHSVKPRIHCSSNQPSTVGATISLARPYLPHYVHDLSRNDLFDRIVKTRMSPGVSVWWCDASIKDRARERSSDHFSCSHGLDAIVGSCDAISQQLSRIPRGVKTVVFMTRAW
jgi:hypothetical protein